MEDKLIIFTYQLITKEPSIACLLRLLTADYATHNLIVKRTSPDCAQVRKQRADERPGALRAAAARVEEARARELADARIQQDLRQVRGRPGALLGSDRVGPLRRLRAGRLRQGARAYEYAGCGPESATKSCAAPTQHKSKADEDESGPAA